MRLMTIVAKKKVQNFEVWNLKDVLRSFVFHFLVLGLNNKKFQFQSLYTFFNYSEFIEKDKG